jgi:hypothetical protein
MRLKSGSLAGAGRGLLIFLARSAALIGAIHEVGKDRTVRAVIAAARICQMTQRVHHCLHFTNSNFKTGDLLKRNLFHVGTLPRTILPERQ